MQYEEILSGMQESYRRLTGFDADSASDIGIRLRVLAEQLAALYRRAEELSRQALPQTSTGTALEHHAECRGLFRKPARRAEGVLRFSRETPAQQDIPIGAGIICATRPDPPLQFETAEDAVLPAGEREVDVPARAAAAGSAGNVAPGAVCLMVTAPGGISGATNPAPFAGGSDEESDEALRARLLYAFRNIANGTNCAFYYDRAMQQEDVRSAAVIPRARGRGTVDVVIHCAVDGEGTREALTQELGRAREVNVDVQVRGAKTQPVALSLTLAPREGCAYEEVAARCGEAFRSFLAGLGVGEPLLLARLVSSLLEQEGVYNLAAVAPERDLHPAADTVLVPGAVSVERMAQG